MTIAVHIPDDRFVCNLAADPATARDCFFPDRLFTLAGEKNRPRGKGTPTERAAQ